MESKSYDVVLLPETRLREEAIQLSKKLEEFGVYFALGHETFFPHVSLYMLQLDGEGLNQAKSLLSSIASRMNKVELVADHYHYESDYVDVEYAKSNELVQAQERVITDLNPIRDGMRDKDQVRLSEATGETRENLTRFGYRSIGNLFKPHLTFTRFDNPQEEVIKSFPNITNFNGDCTALGIFEMGDNGTCVRKIAAWQLKEN